ncbi:hypothetical protein MCHI_001316 [Candidatus Magnetoovum chiemensis]|nr:hypothetical protein MCHI_001316 [Candidatus Magnetoovum chiemensis]
MKKWKIFTGLIVIFTAGSILGAVFSGFYIKHKMNSFFFGGHRDRVEMIMEHISKELKLNKDQQYKIKEVIVDTELELVKFRQKHEQEVETIITQSKERIKEYLTESQQKRLELFYENMKAHRPLKMPPPPMPDDHAPHKQP